MATNGYKHWAVIHSIAMPHQGNYMTAAMFITNVPDQLKYQAVKDAIDQAGIYFGDGGVPWGNHSLYPDDDWIAGWRMEFGDPARRQMLYDDLLEQGKVEKRITLRLPGFAHNFVVNAASYSNISANQFITNVLEERMISTVLTHERENLQAALGEYIQTLERVYADNNQVDRDLHVKAGAGVVGSAYQQYIDACSRSKVTPEYALVQCVPAHIKREVAAMGSA